MMHLNLTFPPTIAAASLSTSSSDDQPQAPTISGIAVPIGVPSAPAMDGECYQFDAPPENAEQLLDVVDEHHDDAVCGRLAEPMTHAEDHLAAVARIFNTTRGRDLLEETREAVKTGFSISAAFDKFTVDDDGVRHVTEWTARHLGVVRAPAFAQSAGLTVAASKGNTMGTTTETTTPPALVELPSVTELAAEVAKHMDAAAKQPVHPLAAFSSRAAFLAAFQAADEDARRELQAAFALVDQVTTNNPGVIPPGWRTDIKANLDKRRPLVDMTGGSIGLPDSGMDSSWPYFDGDLDTIITQQMAEKNQLDSVRIDIKKATEAIKTAGVVSDISYQLIMRSSPSYLAAYQAICETAWARYTEAKYETTLAARATSLAATTLTAPNLRALMWDISAAVEDATGAPASGVLVAGDVWTALGHMDDFANPKYGTQNIAGTSDASTLSVNLNGLPIKRGPFLPAGTVLGTNEAAAKFAEQGPMVATEEDVTRLGRNVAVWGMYEDAEVYFPAGVVKATVTAPAP